MADEEAKNPGTPGRMPENADRDAGFDGAAGGAGASTGKADSAKQGKGVGSGGSAIPGIGERKTDAAAGPGTDGTVLPGNMPRTGGPNRTET